MEKDSGKIKVLKTARLSARISPLLRDALEALAEGQNMTLSEMINALIIRELQTNNITIHIDKKIV